MNTANAQLSHLKQANPQQIFPKERLFNAVLFEVFALLLTIPLSKFITDKETEDVAIVGVLMSLYCVFWNYVYNYIFDKICRDDREHRKLAIRVFHSIGFETSLIVATVPFIAFMLDITLLAALKLEAGLLIFFFVYTFIFNWSYDKFIHKLVNKVLIHSI